MPNYQNSLIYKIVCNETGKVYIGSTTQNLAKRIGGHRSNYNHYLNGFGKYVTSFAILENENYSYVLVEKYSCDDKLELHARERFYIESMVCVNKNIPGRSMKEYCKKYNKTNEGKIKIRRAEYNKVNKEKIAENYQANKDLIRIRNVKYRRENIEKLTTKYSCECGGTYVYRGKARHLLCRKHQTYLFNL